MSIGVEVELQLLDRHTYDLTPASPKILAQVGFGNPKIKAEILQSMLEVNTSICRNANEVQEDLQASFGIVRDVCDEIGVKLASTGTHPFARYNERKIFPAKRYQDLIDRNQWIARRLMIFGLHVHVGMESGDDAIRMNNALLHYLPVILALSASSPFWQGEDTGLASSRITFFEALPTGGHPCLLKNWDDFIRLHSSMIRSEAIRSTKDIWWDIRPCPHYGTLEIRICDGPATLAETVSLVAFIHALCHWLRERMADGEKIPPPAYWVLRENKWRASRHGLDADFIINNRGDSIPMRKFIMTLLKRIEGISRRIGYTEHLEFLKTCMAQGLSYDRQRALGSDPLNIIKFVSDEFDAGMPLWQSKVAAMAPR
jgi:glutamate---cysteine ligase / carboxylate-amine ligase